MPDCCARGNGPGKKNDDPSGNHKISFDICFYSLYMTDEPIVGHQPSAQRCRRTDFGGPE
jgi:hypothetical protein